MLGVEAQPLHPERAAREQVGVEAGAVRSVAGEVLARPPEGVREQELRVGAQRRARARTNAESGPWRNSFIASAHSRRDDGLDDRVGLRVDQPDVEAFRVRVHRLERALDRAQPQLAPEAQPHRQVLAPQQLGPLLVDPEHAVGDDPPGRLGRAAAVPAGDEGDVLDREQARLEALERVGERPGHAVDALVVPEPGHRARGRLLGAQHELGTLLARHPGAALGRHLQPVESVARADLAEQDRDALALQVERAVAHRHADELRPQKLRIGRHDPASPSVWASSERRRSSAASASVIAASSPCRTCSRSATVTPTRWSVTRFCG